LGVEAKLADQRPQQHPLNRYALAASRIGQLPAILAPRRARQVLKVQARLPPRLRPDEKFARGNRLCSVDDGCNPVLADGRLLHVVNGGPSRFSVTITVSPPGGCYSTEPMM